VYNGPGGDGDVDRGHLAGDGVGDAPDAA